MREKLVITIIEQPLWGNIIQPVWVREEASDSLTILEIADEKSSYFSSLSAVQQEIVVLAEKYSVKSLMKSYSKDKTVTDFQKNVSDKTIELYIRPTIEKYQLQIIDRLPQSGLDVYYREGGVKKRTLFDYNKIETSQNHALAIFNFRRDESVGLRYFISVKWKHEEIELNGKFSVMICNDPAVVVVDDKLLVFKDIDAKKLLPFFSKEYVSVPKASEKAYIEKFVANCVKNNVVNAQGIDIQEIEPKSKALLSLTNGWDMLPVLNLDFMYEDKAYPFDATEKKIVEPVEKNGEISLIWFHRNREWENSRVRLLEENGLKKVGINGFRVNKPDEDENIDLLIDWIRSHQDILSHFTFSQNVDDKKYFLGEISVDNILDEKQDWFDIRSEAVFGEFRIPFVRFKNHILNDIREYVLPDGSIAILPAEWFTRYHELMFFGKKIGDDIRLQKYHYQLVDLLNIDAHKQVSDFHLKELLPVPDGVNATLRQYQRKGFSWLMHLMENGFGGCLADDMGLGKTLQTIALLQYVHLQRKKANTGKKINPTGQLSFFEEDNLEQNTSKDYPPSLVVMPTSLLHNWQNELKRFTPNQKVYLYSGDKRMKSKDLDKFFRMFDVILTTYGTLRIDIDMLERCTFHHFVLDESQYVKNPNSMTYKAVKRINAMHKLALTGTPIENSLSDLWAQFNIVNEGMLGTQSAFQKTYINPINRNNKEKEEILLKIIQPFILRRTKSEVAPELPPLTEETIYCDMSEQQQKCYNHEKNKIRNNLMIGDQLADSSKFAFITLQGLTRLRLLANHPGLLEPSYTEDSGKFEQVVMYLETLRSSNHKVLVFSSFVKHLRLFSRYFDEKDWKYAWLTGETNVQDREKEIDRYMRNEDVNCFFISLKAGGVGLNLTAADYVFILDPWWNPAAEMQAISRSHRIGQNKNVIVYRFISSGSIEEKIRQLQESKSKLAETFISSSNPLSNMSKEEIERLIS
ncbi:DEAD/DEAH box helicase [Dysgonomonas sp. 520]|uniref:DEAD/DEAH box helicase n=1 Tax=Dysgonomonas sp. 520 TaxID=2302931 RepID=UPI0013D3855A|nr:DEAD/DEAH box helicase [Dysgonomonas sp. 520]NDW08950.1 DEAD/DEAH box helicase [Dysgonomonas sp. 520]